MRIIAIGLALVGLSLLRAHAVLPPSGTGPRATWARLPH